MKTTPKPNATKKSSGELLPPPPPPPDADELVLGEAEVVVCGGDTVLEGVAVGAEVAIALVACWAALATTERSESPMLLTAAMVKGGAAPVGYAGVLGAG